MPDAIIIPFELPLPQVLPTIDNAEKILSLYEPDLHVIVRRKAGAEVEFGNKLLLGENSQGVIIDWDLIQGLPPADSKLLPGSVGRMKQGYGPQLKAATTDRGFDSEDNRAILGSEGIYNGMCPRSVPELECRSRSWKFKRLQRRRSHTEGRVGIVKNAFLEGRMLSTGFAHRELRVTWTVRVRNLWVLARMQRAAAAAAERQAA